MLVPCFILDRFSKQQKCEDFKAQSLGRDEYPEDYDIEGFVYQGRAAAKQNDFGSSVSRTKIVSGLGRLARLIGLAG